MHTAYCSLFLPILNEARRELSKVMAVAGGTISAKVEGSTDSARGNLHIFREP